MSRHVQSSNRRRGVLFLAVTLALLAVLVAAAALLERRIYAPVETTEPIKTEETDAVTELPSVPTEPAEETMPTLAADAMGGKQVLNVLITGQDRRDPDSWGRSDTMILCSINAEADTVTMVSFLRDLYVPIPGHGSNKLNAAYSWGGVELLNETLTQNFEVSIDGNIELDFFDFVVLIDHLGGVNVKLTEAEVNYLQNRGHEGLAAGDNCLTGEQALAYSRIRYLDSDFVRTERQRTILTQVFNRLQALDWNELTDAMDLLLENSTLSFSRDELLLYTIGFYPVLQDGDIITSRIPADDTWEYSTVSGMSVVKADLESNREVLRDLLGDSEEE